MKTLILGYNGFYSLVTQLNIIFNTISAELGVSKLRAIKKAQLFFQDKQVVIQSTGVQGAIYIVGSYFQGATSAGLVARTVGLARLAGVSGLSILKAQFALIITIPTTGAIFFLWMWIISWK